MRAGAGRRVEIEQVTVTGERAVGHTGIGRVDHMRVRVPVELIAEHAIDAPEVRIGEGELIDGFVLKGERIHRLLVLTPGDVADEPGVVEHETLTAERAFGAAGRVGEPGLVDLGDLRIGHDRITRIGRHPVGIVVDEGGDVFRFHHGLEPLVGGGRVAEPRTQRQGVGAFGKRVLIDVFMTQAGVEGHLARLDRLGEGGGGVRFGRGRSLGESDAGGRQHGEEEQVRFHGVGTVGEIRAKLRRERIGT